jgi:nicotinate phosphoribosyltransferase
MAQIHAQRNFTMLVDFYELTMANGYWNQGMQDVECVFDMFFRTIPDKGGYAVMAGLDQLIEYLQDLHFTEEDIEYLRSKHCFCEEFLAYLRDFHFTCDVWAIPEGTPVFPQEPIVIVRGPAIQAQLVETMVLLSINFQSLIATKSSRINRSAKGRAVMEFGSRRAQSYDAAILGARAAYIGGCNATACTITDEYYGIPAVGTMAHSWVQMFDTEYESFVAYAKTYPDNCTLLVDTYDVLHSGIPNAIRVFNEVVVPAGFRPKGIRIDSGDIAYLSKCARFMLDEAGFPDCKIVASNSLDEYLIRDLLQQGAKIDSFGVGENLITSKSSAVFGGVYKLAAVRENGELVGRIKLSASIEKVTTPGFKKVYRLYDRNTGKAHADLVTLFDETIDETKPLTIFDPTAVWKQTTLSNFCAVPLLQQVFDKGKLVYETPDLPEIQRHCREQLDTLWPEVLRFENPHGYYVDLSKKLWDLKNEMIFQQKVAR